MSKRSFEPLWELSGEAALRNAVGEEIVKALNQPFHYLGKGMWTFVFVSKDNKYVIKFHRYNRFLAKKLAYPILAFFSHKKKPIKDSEAVVFENFLGHKIAFEHFQEESGLVYLHLNKTGHLKKKLTIFDKIGIRYELDLDSMEFLVQKRAQLVYPNVKRMLEEGNIEEAKKAIDRLLILMCQRQEKGIYDSDSKIDANVGFGEGNAVQIDTGSLNFYQNFPGPLEYSTRREELLGHTKKFRHWLAEHSPALQSYLENQIEQLPEIDFVSKYRQ